MAFGERLYLAWFRGSRYLLHRWIRPTILRCDPSTLNLDEDDVPVYVLNFRSTADLLVADQACEAAGLPRPVTTEDGKSAYLFLNQPEGWFGRRSPRQQAEAVRSLVSDANENERPIKLVPVSFFWGHQPDREKSIFKLILSENWSVTNRFKKFFAILFHPNHILVQFGEPIRIALINDTEAFEDSADREARRLMRLLRVHFREQRQAILGPDLSHRRTLMTTILESPEVVAAMEKEVQRGDSDIERVKRKAFAQITEIASDQSYRVIRFFHVLLTWLWNNLYDGIRVNNIERVKTAAQTHEIIYIPCHRSHIDYLLLSYVLYHNGLTPPHIAAGKNLNLPVVGTLLRRAGAFFMRRSFQGDALYKAVFDEYLHQMFVRGYSVEYFIEGGRSRTGRTLVPRTGMLSMTIRSFQRDASKPICMMPVYFGYERVLESTAYLSELSGQAKKTESVFDMFGVFSSFREAFGEVTVNFGEPLMLAEFLDEHLPNWQGETETADFSEACAKLAHNLASRINDAAAVSPVALLATALLATPRQTMDREHLLNQITLLKQLAEKEQYSSSYVVHEADAEEQLALATEIIGLNVHNHDFGTTVSADPTQAVLLTYYRNNVAHIFATPALIASMLLAARSINKQALLAQCEQLDGFIASELFINDSTAPANRIERALDNLITLNLVTANGDTLSVPETSSASFVSLRELARCTQASLERFFIVCSLLTRSRFASVRELETAAAGVGERMSVLYGINSPDFFERSLFGTFVITLREAELVGNEDGSLFAKPSLADLTDLLAANLEPDIQYNIIQLVTQGLSQEEDTGDAEEAA